jgi:hypothetical protein
MPIIVCGKALYVFLACPVDVFEEGLKPPGKVVKIAVKEHGVKVGGYVFRV